MLLKAACTGCSSAPLASPSIVTTVDADAWAASIGARLHRLAVDMDDAGAALRGVAADMRAGQAEILAQEVNQQRSVLDGPATFGRSPRDRRRTSFLLAVGAVQAGPDRLRLPAPSVCRRRPEALGRMLPPPARVYCTFDRTAADIKIAKRRMPHDAASSRRGQAGLSTEECRRVARMHRIWLRDGRPGGRGRRRRRFRCRGRRRGAALGRRLCLSVLLAFRFRSCRALPGADLEARSCPCRLLHRRRNDAGRDRGGTYAGDPAAGAPFHRGCRDDRQHRRQRHGRHRRGGRRLKRRSPAAPPATPIIAVSRSA